MGAAAVVALIGASLAHAALPPTMAAIGDSLSNGWAAGGSSDPFTSGSWSTGTRADVNSHRKRIEAAATGSARMTWAKNYARAGTLAWQRTRPDLATQAAKVPIGTAYVTVSVGTGELCSSHVDTLAELNNRVSKIPRGLREALQITFRRNPQARVLVMSVPNWYSLWETFNGDPVISGKWEAKGACELLLQPDSGPTRSEVDGKTQLANSHLADVCGEFARCFFDNDAAYNNAWSAEQLSNLDAFHFSYEGNNQIAGLTYAQGPYAGVNGEFDGLNLRILVKGAKKLTRNRVRVSFDTFPNAAAKILIRKRGRVVGRAETFANGDGKVVKRIQLRSNRGRLKAVMKVQWGGQRETAKRAVS